MQLQFDIAQVTCYSVQLTANGFQPALERLHDAFMEVAGEL
jgi:hypothetical protein